MAEKNQSITSICEALGSNGEGIFHYDGSIFFVPYCLPKETVKFHVLKMKDGVGYGKVEEIIVPAENRIREKCSAFARCGGCQLQHMKYEEQLSFKQKLVADCLKKIGGITAKVAPVVPSNKIYGYRNKLQLPVGVDKEGRTVIGFYAERSHRIVPISECAIHPEWSKKIIAVLSQYMFECGITGYNEEKKTGFIRHIIVREMEEKFIITLVSAKETVPSLTYFCQLIREIFPVFTLWLNINKKDNNVIFGEDFRLIDGNGFFEGKESEICYEAGPQTFIQVNADVRKVMYQKAIESVATCGDEVVIDAYSGGGLMTAMAAKKVKRVYGIEIEPEAVKCADNLKEKNGLTNMINICGKVEDKIFDILEKEKGEKIRLILDPPRAGIARSVLKALLDSKISRLTIISCNPATLARDLGILTGNLTEEEGGKLTKSSAEGGYEVLSVQPYDMFPQTKHVETLVELRTKS